MSPLLLAAALRCVLAGPHGVDGHVVPLPPVIVEGQPPAPLPAPSSAPSTEPSSEPQEPPAEPVPAAPPDALVEPAPPPPSVAERPPTPPGEPLDLLPRAPLDGFWAYALEVAAATGTAQLLSLASCVPLVGPVAYAVVAPPIIVNVIERSAREWTTTGPGSRDAALLTAHVVEGVAGLFMLGGQVVLLGTVGSIALLTIGINSNDVATVTAGGLLLAGSATGGLGLLGLMPLGIAAGLVGPHLEVLAYRYLGGEREPVPPTDGGGRADDETGNPDGAWAPTTPTRGTP